MFRGGLPSSREDGDPFVPGLYEQTFPAAHAPLQHAVFAAVPPPAHGVAGAVGFTPAGTQQILVPATAVHAAFPAVPVPVEQHVPAAPTVHVSRSTEQHLVFAPAGPVPVHVRGVAHVAGAPVHVAPPVRAAGPTHVLAEAPAPPALHTPVQHGKAPAAVQPPPAGVQEALHTPLTHRLPLVPGAHVCLQAPQLALSEPLTLMHFPWHFVFPPLHFFFFFLCLWW
jgi:hypothetical protein